MRRENCLQCACLRRAAVAVAGSSRPGAVADTTPWTIAPTPLAGCPFNALKFRLKPASTPTATDLFNTYMVNPP